MICTYLGSVIPGESYAWIRVGWRGFSGRASDWLAEQPPTNQGPGCGIPVGGPAWVMAWRSLGDPISWTCRLSISSVTVIVVLMCLYNCKTICIKSRSKFVYNILKEGGIHNWDGRLTDEIHNHCILHHRLWIQYIGALMQEGRNSIANALELRLLLH